MKIHTHQYPLLLTMAEPGTLQCNYEDKEELYSGRTDVYKATYRQGATLDEDILSAPKGVAKKRHCVEKGLGWQNQTTSWVLAGSGKDQRELNLCQPGKKPVPILQTDANSAMPSATQRYFWTTHYDVESNEQALRQWDTQTKTWTTVWGGGGFQLQATASDPREDRLLFTVQPDQKSPAELWEWNSSAGKSRQIHLPKPLDCYEMALSPSGQTLAFVDEQDDSALKTYDFATGLVRVISNDEEEEEYDCLFSEPGTSSHGSPAWSPDGSRIFYTRYTFGMNEDEMYSGATLFVATPDGQQRGALLGLPWNEEGVYSVQVGPCKSVGEGKRPDSLLGCGRA